MKTPEEMAAIFRAMPKKEKTNPYWAFDYESRAILKKHGGAEPTPFLAENQLGVLHKARQYFRLMCEGFGAEAQVLCVRAVDMGAFTNIGVPVLSERLQFAGEDAGLVVLPQVNTPVNSIISEAFWQEHVAGKGICPLARIHSHHRLDAYQSETDYSTLNSNTLEIVMGRVMDEKLHIAYWLDEHGKDTKAYVFHATETGMPGKFTAGCTKRLPVPGQLATP